jgi:hypothetical protein
MQHLLYYPPLATKAMVGIRELVKRHREWCSDVRRAGDALYVPDTRSDEDKDKETEVQRRIATAREQVSAPLWSLCSVSFCSVCVPAILMKRRAKPKLKKQGEDSL